MHSSVYAQLQFSCDKNQALLEANLVIQDTVAITDNKKSEIQKLISCLKEHDLVEKADELNRFITSLETSISVISEESLPDLKQEIKDESEKAVDLKEELESTLRKSEKSANNELDESKNRILNFENDLTKLKIKLLETKININKDLTEKIHYFESINTKFKDFSLRAVKEKGSDLESLFYEVQNIWLELNKENYYDFFTKSNIRNLPIVPAIPGTLVNLETSNINNLHYDINELRRDILKEYTAKKEQEIKLLNQLVINSNVLRTKIFERLGFEFFVKTLFTLDSLELVKNEVINSPYRIISYFYSKFLYIREQLTLKGEGLKTLSFNLFTFVTYIIAFLGLRYLFNLIVRKGDLVLNHLTRGGHKNSLLRMVNHVWFRFRELVNPLLWLLVSFIIIEKNLLVDLIYLIKIFQVYLFSILLQNIVKYFLGSVSRLDSSNFYSFKKKSDHTSNRFRNIFMFYFYGLILFEMTVGQVYLYNILNLLILLYSLYMLIYESAKWESEFTTYSEKKFSGVIVEKYFDFLKIVPTKLRSLFLFVFIVVFNLIDFVISITENFEFSKKVSANLFKRQIENVEAHEGADRHIPQEYKDLFSPKSLDIFDDYVVNNTELETSFKTEILEWHNQVSEEHSLVLYGDKGVGKTTLIKKMISEIKVDKEFDYVYSQVPPKVTTKSALYDYLKTVFNIPMTDSHTSINDVDKKLTKKIVVVLDECQNIYLSKTGGFDAYNELTRIINSNTTNIFWVLSFNRYSWLYLHRAFGKTQYFRNVFEVKGWSDTSIKELIMKRHSQSSFRLSFDLLINATKSNDEIDRYSSIEAKFFKLLWEMSRGNPRAALYLWISALSKRSANMFNVNIPKEYSISGTEKLADDLMFVVAELLRHENLTSYEIIETTNLPPGIVRNTIKFGLEKKYFIRNEQGRYLVDSLSQYGLTKYLRLKNFIYGN